MDPIEEALKEYIVREIMSDSAGASVGSDDPLIDDGIIDSLGIFTLIAFMEERFGVKVQPEDVVLDNFRSVRTIRALVAARLQEAPAAGTNGACAAPKAADQSRADQ
jgi:acyl carrier protein